MNTKIKTTFFWFRRNKKWVTVAGILIVSGTFLLADILRASPTTLRQEINILDTTYSATNVVISSNERAQIDTDQFSTTVTYYFEIVGSATSGSSGNIHLRRSGTTTDDSTIAISSLGTSATRLRSSSFSPPSGQTEYFVHADAGGAGKSININAARIIAIQTSSSLTDTETQIEVGNHETAKTNTAFSALNNPKYWEYTPANWDPAPSFYAETTYKKTDTATPLPTVYNVGAVASNANAISPGLPSGTQTDDLLVMFCETNNQAITASGWTVATNSPQSDATDATRLTVLWRRATGTDPTTTSDSGDHQLCRIVGVRGVVTSGDPWDVTAGGTEATSDTSGSIPGATTTVTNTLVLAAVSTTRDANSTAEFSGWTNASLSSVVEQIDNTTNAGAGGGVGVASGGKSTAGSYGNTTVTHATSSRKGLWSGALIPAIDTSPTVTIKLQEDNGTFGSWTDVVNGTIVNASASSGTTARVRTGTAFTPVNGRHYRIVASITNGTGHTYDIYNAKIIAEQSSSISKLEAQYLLANNGSFGGSTGLKDYDTRWDATEWSGVTNTYYHEANGVASGTGALKLQSDPNGTPADVTNSTLSTVIEVERSSALTMPGSATDIDTNVTTTGTLNASRIIVAVTVNPPNNVPTAPTLSSPANSSTGIGTTPTLQLRSPDADNDYLRYKIELCSTSNCSSIVRTIDQTVSQTGWTGQDSQSSTAYVGNSIITSSTLASHNYQTPDLATSTQYWWRAYAIDPGGSNTFSSASSIFSFTTAAANATPAAPTLSTPSNSATNISITPVLQLRTTDADNDYLRYKIELCSTSNCSSIVRTIDQTASQTGWSGQDTQSSTAYIGNATITSSTLANHTYQAPALAYSTQYWWRAYAIDPGGSNTFSSASSIFSFTTATGPPPSTGDTVIQGGTHIRGGTRIGN